MKAVQITKPDDLNIIEVKKPEISTAKDVLVKMDSVGICGSDMGIYHGKNAAATYPRVIGHELIGIVEEIGEKVEEVSVGDRVVINQVVPCGNCYPCSIGRENVCDNLQVRGVHIDGGYTEYMVVPQSDLYVLPENITNEEAVMIEPTSIGLQICSRAELNKNDTLLILGMGSLGSTILKIAKYTAKKIIVADIVQDKLDEAIENGADFAINLTEYNLKEKVFELTKDRGVTVSMDAVGSKNSLLDIMEATGPAGRVMALGFSTAPVEINQFQIASKELDVRGSRLQNGKFKEAIEMIEEGQLDFSNDISHTFKLEETQKAFDFIDSKDENIRKIVLKP